MRIFLTRISLLVAGILTSPLAVAQTPKSEFKAKDRFKILSVQAKEIENLFGVPKQGDSIPFKLLSARIVVNDKGETKGTAPTPKILVCHFYNQKKEEIAATPAVVFRITAQNKVASAPPEFKPKTPTEVFFPYDPKTPFRYAIIVVGDESGVIAYAHPTSIKTFGDFDFPEKVYLGRE